MPVGILPKAGSGVSRLSILGLAGDGVAEAFGEALQAEGAALLVLGEAGALHRHVVSDVGNAKGIPADVHHLGRSEEHTSELQSLMRISYAVFGLKKKIKI